MPPKAKKSVRCFIWLQTLEYWEEIRQQLIAELLKKIRNLLKLQEEIQCEAEKLKRNFDDAEISDSLAETFERVTQLRRESASSKFLQHCVDQESQPNPVEILSNILLQSADAENMSNKGVIPKRDESLDEMDKENFRLEQAQFCPNDLKQCTLVPSGSHDSQMQSSHTAQDFVSKLTNASREAVFDPAVREYNAQLLQFVSTNGPQALERLLVDLVNGKAIEESLEKGVKGSVTYKTNNSLGTTNCNGTVAVDVCFDYNQLPKSSNYLLPFANLPHFLNSFDDFPSAHSADDVLYFECQQHSTATRTSASNISPVAQLTEKYFYNANTPSTSSTGSTTPEPEEVELYGNEITQQANTNSPNAESNEIHLCVEVPSNVIELMGEGFLYDEPTPLDEKITKIFDDNMIIDNDIEWIRLGPNDTRLTKCNLCTFDWTDSGQIITRKLLVMLFGHEHLATHTLSGKPSPAFVNVAMPEKSKLNPLIVSDLTHFISITKGLLPREIRHCITTKCSDESKKRRRREKQANKRL